MALSKNLQYIVSGALVLYIVFFTRPAPSAVVNLLASPVAQLAALAIVVYVGASVSLLVAVVAALAVVLSIPSREYAGKEDDKTMEKKDKDKKKAENPTTKAASDLSRLAAAAGEDPPLALSDAARLKVSEAIAGACTAEPLQKDGHLDWTGDPTEAALLLAARSFLPDDLRLQPFAVAAAVAGAAAVAIVVATLVVFTAGVADTPSVWGR
jgi:membrane protein implicated in regulation of membrane protease activity